MNYLAHLFLSCEEEELLIGNYIADSIRLPEVQLYSEGVQKGIQLHRQIDQFTDQHIMVRQSSSRLRPHHRKYAPVVTDILYDYLLANNWERYSSEDFSAFTARIYDILQRNMALMPGSLKRHLPLMIADDWLRSYGSKEGIRFVLGKMDQRTRFPSNFTAGIDHLLADYQAYNTEFNQFFPDILEYVRTQCGTCN